MSDGLLETLPEGVTSRMVADVNGLDMHILEAGDPSQPLMLLLHGFPELAYSWRKVMVPLAEAGFHVVAPDQRGYGRTTGWAEGYDVDLRPYTMFGLVRDVLALLNRLGRSEVACLVGHDFGSPVAAHAALIRPDVFRKLVMMSAPYEGPPAFDAEPGEDVHAAMLRLDPPRKHYQWYYSTASANADMVHAPQGLVSFLRAYYHCKSADWAGNAPYELESWTAAELAKLPNYYVMQADEDMAQTVVPMGPVAGAECDWMAPEELAVYAQEFGRTGFQGGLNWYRCMTDPGLVAEFRLFSGRQIEVPSLFVAGNSDWGIHQKPGALAAMQNRACADMKGVQLIAGAGHWVQQEQPDQVIGAILDFTRS